MLFHDCQAVQAQAGSQLDTNEVSLDIRNPHFYFIIVIKAQSKDSWKDFLTLMLDVLIPVHGLKEGNLNWIVHILSLSRLTWSKYSYTLPSSECCNSWTWFPNRLSSRSNKGTKGTLSISHYNYLFKKEHGTHIPWRQVSTTCLNLKYILVRQLYKLFY